MKTIPKMKKSKYEMAKRKEKWKSINTPLEKLMMIVSVDDCNVIIVI